MRTRQVAAIAILVAILLTIFLVWTQWKFNRLANNMTPATTAVSVQ